MAIIPMSLRSLRLSSKLGSINGKGPLLRRSTGDRQSVGTASATGFDTGAGTGEQKAAPTKSRTGGDMGDEGQVLTPNLHKMRTTRDFFDHKRRETEERLAAETKSSA